MHIISLIICNMYNCIYRSMVSRGSIFETNILSPDKALTTIFSYTVSILSQEFSQIISKIALLLVFHRKDLCNARSKPKMTSKKADVPPF